MSGQKSVFDGWMNSCKILMAQIALHIYGLFGNKSLIGKSLQERKCGFIKQLVVGLCIL